MGTCASRPVLVPTEPPTSSKANRETLQPCNTHSISSRVKELDDSAYDWTPRDEPVRRSSVSAKPEIKAESTAVESIESVPSPAVAETQIGQQPIVKLGEDMLGQPYDVFARGPPIPPCNTARAQVVKNLKVVDAIPVPAIDHIVTLICQVFQVDAALVALFDDNRIFVSNARGFQRGDLPWRWSFCAWSLSPPEPEVLVIEDVDEDARFRDNQVAQSLGIKFYCGSPILGGNRHRLGTLCFVDSKPRKFSAEQLMILANLAEMVGRELERGATLHAQAKTQEAFMSRALECFNTAVAFVDVCAPGWRIMHASPSFAKAAGLRTEEVADALLWDVLEAPAAGFDVIAAAAEIAAAGNEFVLGGIIVNDHAEKGTFDMRLRPAGADVLDEHTSPIGIPTHVSSRPNDAQQYLFVTLSPSRDTPVAAANSGLLPAPGTATSTSSIGRSCTSMESVESAFFVDRGLAPQSVPFEGLEMGPLVGCGSYGRVYRGVYQNTTVAVKICQPRGRRRAVTAEAAWSTVEARARQLAHPHVVRLLRHCTVLTPVHGRGNQKAAQSAKSQGLRQQAVKLWDSKPNLRPAAVPALKAMQARRVVRGRGSSADSARSMAASPYASPMSSSPYTSLTNETLATAAPRLVDNAHDLPGKEVTTSPAAADEMPTAESPYVNLQSASGSASDPQVSTTPEAPSVSCTPASTANASPQTSSPHTSSPHTSAESSRDSGATASSASSSIDRLGAGGPGQNTPGRAATKHDTKQRLNVSPFSMAPTRVQGGNSFASSGDAFGMSAFSAAGGDRSFNKEAVQEESSTNFSSNSGSSGAYTRTTTSSSPHMSSSNVTTSNVMTSGSEHSSKAASAGEVETWQLMEYCDRGSLQGAIDKGWFRKERTTRLVGGNFSVILAVASEVCSAMVYLHSEGVVHGDLAGGNVLLMSQSSSPHGFTAKVADFGLARFLSLDASHEADNSYGTVTHMPPEVLNGEPFQRPADVWSFGVLLWEMWCGVRAWAGFTRPQIMLAVAIHLRPLVFPAATPPQFQALAASCMSNDPAARPSFAQLQDALRAMAHADQ